MCIRDRLPKYLIQNHHEGIVSREIFDAVQLEMARRNAKALDSALGPHAPPVGRPVWRCVSRLDYGKKFCTQSPTLDEEPDVYKRQPPGSPGTPRSAWRPSGN